MRIAGGEAPASASQLEVEPIEAVGAFAAFGAFLGALAAYLSLRLDEATEWAMHGMVLGGSMGVLAVILKALI